MNIVTVFNEKLQFSVTAYVVNAVCTVPCATVDATVNNILIKTLFNCSLTTLCGPLCPTVSLQACWREHSGGASNPMTFVHLECTNFPVNVGQENVLAIEQITTCVLVRKTCSVSTGMN